MRPRRRKTAAGFLKTIRMKNSKMAFTANKNRQGGVEFSCAVGACTLTDPATVERAYQILRALDHPVTVSGWVPPVLVAEPAKPVKLKAWKTGPPEEPFNVVALPIPAPWPGVRAFLFKLPRLRQWVVAEVTTGAWINQPLNSPESAVLALLSRMQRYKTEDVLQLVERCASDVGTINE